MKLLIMIKQLFLGISLIIFFLTANAYGSASMGFPSKQSVKKFQKAHQAIVNKEYRLAEYWLKDAFPDLWQIDDTLLYYQGLIALHTKKWNQSEILFQAILQNSLDSIWKANAYQGLAEIYAYHKKYQQSEDMYESAKSHLPEINHRDMDIKRLQLYLSAKKKSASIALAKKLMLSSRSEAELMQLTEWTSAIRKRFKVDVMAWLADSTSRQITLCESFAEYSQWDDIVLRLKPLVSKNITHAHRVKMKWLLAQSYRWLHDYDQALALLHEIKQYARTFSYLDAIPSLMVNLYAKKSEYSKALAIRKKQLKKLNPKSRLAGLTAYRIAYLHMDKGAYRFAIAKWTNVLAKYKLRGKLRTMANWYLAWCYYQTKNYAKAVRIFDQLLKGSAKKYHINDRIMYWKAVALTRIKQRQTGKALFQTLIQKYPYGYYAQLARLRLKRRPINMHTLFSRKLKRIKLNNSSIRFAPNDTYAIHVNRAIIFDAMGLSDLVQKELAHVTIAGKKDYADVLRSLAEKNNAYYFGVKVAGLYYKGSVKNAYTNYQAHRSVASRFPPAYDLVIMPLSRLLQINPILIWSLMRTESFFQEKVVSSAGAVGLMQLMPYTANRFKQYANNRAISRKQLMNPTLNITLGMHYIHTLNTMFPDHPIAMIASYNAGEQAAGRWVQSNKKQSIDEWIEEIPYAETNLYVKKVMTAYWNYQRIYGKKSY